MDHPRPSRQHRAPTSPSSRPRQHTRTTPPRSRMPEWLGNPDFHLSHRAKLLRKEPKFYKTVFPDADLDLDYIWPEPKHEFYPAEPEGDILWILRDPHTEIDPQTLDHTWRCRRSAAAALPAPDAPRRRLLPRLRRRRLAPPVQAAAQAAAQAAREEAHPEAPGARRRHSPPSPARPPSRFRSRTATSSPSGRCWAVPSRSTTAASAATSPSPR